MSVCTQELPVLCPHEVHRSTEKLVEQRIPKCKVGRPGSSQHGCRQYRCDLRDGCLRRINS